ncbi:MAG: transposase, partial [Rhabdochlamydiaceae bacterium]
MARKKSPYPKWVTEHRKPGTEIRKIGDRYYIYSVSAYYDAERKKGRKKTGKYLGRITEKEGFIEAAFRKVPKTYSPVNTESLSTKDYGLWAFLQESCQDIVDGVKQYFPEQWEWMLVALYCRLVHISPLKNMSYYYRRSFLSEAFDISVSSKTMAALIKDLGSNRSPIIQYMKHLSGDRNLVLMDATSIVSYSENLTRVEKGLTKYKSFEPLFNLLYFYCPNNYMPAYYRLFNGNIKDVKMVTMALKESGYQNAMIIADKGFYSAANLKLLEKEKLKYIIPLHRNST